MVFKRKLKKIILPILFSSALVAGIIQVAQSFLIRSAGLHSTANSGVFSQGLGRRSSTRLLSQAAKNLPEQFVRFWGISHFDSSETSGSGADPYGRDGLLTAAFDSYSGNSLSAGDGLDEFQSGFSSPFRNTGDSGRFQMGFESGFYSGSYSQQGALVGGGLGAGGIQEYAGFNSRMSSRYADSESVPEPFTVVGTLIGGAAAWRMRKKLKR